MAFDVRESRKSDRVFDARESDAPDFDCRGCRAGVDARFLGRLVTCASMLRAELTTKGMVKARLAQG
jgi:hypothetical protein